MDAGMQLMGDRLKEVYQLLKSVVAFDADESVREHAQATLQLLNEVVASLFATEDPIPAAHTLKIVS